MVTDGRSIEVDSCIKVVHDFSGTDQFGAFDSALELVPGVQVEDVALILILDDFDQPAHVLKTTIQVLLRSVVRTYQLC